MLGVESGDLGLKGPLVQNGWEHKNQILSLSES